MDIHRKAMFMQDFYEKIMFDDNGISYSVKKIDGDEIRPFRPLDFMNCAVPDFSVWDTHNTVNAQGYYSYEDSVMTAGFYLAAQCYRYRVTGDKKALDEAYKAFRSLRIVYMFGVNENKPGFMCKPYGGRLSNQTVMDQYIGAIWGMFEFFPIASDETKCEIIEMSKSFADFWRKNQYELYYFGNYWDMKKDYHAYNAIITAMNMAAWHYTREDLYLAEAERILQDAKWMYETNMDVLKRDCLSALEERREGKKAFEGGPVGFSNLYADYLEDDEFLFWESTAHAHYLALSADIINRVKPDMIAADMPDLMYKWMDLWHYGVGEDCAPFYWYAINIRTGQWRSMPLTPLLPREEWPYAEKFEGYLSQIRYFSLASFGQAAEITYLSNTDTKRKDEARLLAMKILNSLDGTRMRVFYDFDGEQLLPDLRHLYNMFYGNSVNLYLATYWRGKLIGIID